MSAPAAKASRAMGPADEVYEPLAETAPLARRLALEHCRSEHGCRTYHGIWQHLRLLGLNTTVRVDRAFFLGTLRRLARGGSRRVLVAATADYGMLAQILFAFRAEGVEPDCMLLDRCAAPLRLNDDYARRAGARLETIQTDILAAACEPVEVLCTHSFLGFVPAEKRVEVARVWFRLLRPGGHLVTSNVIRPADGWDAAPNAPANVERFRQRVLAAARAYGPALGIEPELLAAEAASLKATRRPNPVRTLEEIGAFLEAAGLRIERLRAEPDPPDRIGPMCEPGMPSKRAQVIARRPA
jgi:SAM-dependent methyltransferase